MSAQGEDLLAVEYLYAIESAHWQGDDSRFYVPNRVVAYRITKKTPKRIYYIRRQSGHQRADGTFPRTEIGYVNRQQIEAEGEIFNKAAGWWAPDSHLYLTPPSLEVYAPAPPNLAELKAAMRAAHPDMGGSHEEFLAAHQAYEQARVNVQRLEAQR
ncbi:hypothetical protein OH810_31670 (plasmid) [Streptomyces albidoflavus]|uniref:hypothetical protein n=1 Tax=Streptomyces albidoflavus TaxID=1886 RepID=UPI002F91410E|nr:hypothetical protein OH810_31670 [Streptomyces albidoflavus]